MGHVWDGKGKGDPYQALTQSPAHRVSLEARVSREDILLQAESSGVGRILTRSGSTSQGEAPGRGGHLGGSFPGQWVTVSHVTLPSGSYVAA